VDFAEVSLVVFVIDVGWSEACASICFPFIENYYMFQIVI
jgi:hypothetical protein